MEAEKDGNWAQAEKLYFQAVQTCPSDDRSRCRYAEVLWRKGDHNGAIANMEEAVRLSNQSPDQVVRLGRMHFEAADLQQAQSKCSRAIENDRNLASAWALRGDIARKEGKTDDALAFYLRAKSLPNCPEDVPLTIADIYGELGRPQRALAVLQSLAENYPPNYVPAAIVYREGLALRALGRNDQAADCFLTVCQGNQPQPEYFHHLADARLACGDVANARLAAQNALNLDPNFAPARQLLDQIKPLGQELSKLP